MHDTATVRRFLDRVAASAPGGCWQWKDRRPYASAYVDLEGVGFGVGYATFEGAQAHRIAYEIFWGPIPADYVVHHHCGNGVCVNPAHLEVFSRTEHTQWHLRNK